MLKYLDDLGWVALIIFGFLAYYLHHELTDHADAGEGITDIKIAAQAAKLSAFW